MSNALLSARGSRIEAVWCDLVGDGKHKVSVLFESGATRVIEHDDLEAALTDYRALVKAQRSGEVVEGGGR